MWDYNSDHGPVDTIINDGCDKGTSWYGPVDTVGHNERRFQNLCVLQGVALVTSRATTCKCIYERWSTMHSFTRGTLPNIVGP